MSPADARSANPHRARKGQVEGYSQKRWCSATRAAGVAGLTGSHNLRHPGPRQDGARGRPPVGTAHSRDIARHHTKFSNPTPAKSANRRRGTHHSHQAQHQAAVARNSPRGATGVASIQLGVRGGRHELNQPSQLDLPVHAPSHQGGEGKGIGIGVGLWGPELWRCRAPSRCPPRPDECNRASMGREGTLSSRF